MVIRLKNAHVMDGEKCLIQDLEIPCMEPRSTVAVVFLFWSCRIVFFVAGSCGCACDIFGSRVFFL